MPENDLLVHAKGRKEERVERYANKSSVDKACKK